MNRHLAFIALFITIATCVLAQQPGTPSKNTQPVSKSRVLSVDSAVVTKHQVTIKGKVVPYTATAGCMPIWAEDGRPVAGVFYTYYERDDVADKSTRPLVISFNGGPGTPSVW